MGCWVLAAEAGCWMLGCLLLANLDEVGAREQRRERERDRQREDLEIMFAIFVFKIHENTLLYIYQHFESCNYLYYYYLCNFDCNLELKF